LPDRTLAQQLSGAFVLFGTLVAAAFFVTALAYGVSWGWLRPELVRSELAVGAESASHVAMLEEANGLSGYLLTHNDRFLDAYTRGELDLARANEALTAYIGSVPELATAIVGKRLAEERWRERWGHAVADTRPEALVPSMAEGKALFDAYRSEEGVLAAGLTRRNEILSRRDAQMVASRVALELTVFIAVLFLAVRQHGALSVAIVAPVAALLRHIRRIRDGQMEATADPAAPRELAELGEGLNEMVRSLAAAQELAATRDDALRNHSVRLRQILEASREFAESLNLTYVVGAVRESTAQVGGYARVIVWLMDSEQKRLVISDESEALVSSDAPVELGHGLAGRAAKSGRITFEALGGQVRFGDVSAEPVCAVAIPLIVGARVVGALEARHAEPRIVTLEAMEVIEMLAANAPDPVENVK
jgi:hypothetical protein